MCGIAGFIQHQDRWTKSTKKAIMQQLLYGTALRGWDSTGVFFAGNKIQGIKFVKSSVPAIEYFEDKKVTKYWDDYIDQARFVIGHCRAATVGAVNTENAHPFLRGDIVLVHNGTLTQWDQKDLKQDEKVDSAAIASYFNEKKPEQMYLEDRLAYLRGAFALVWYDRREECLYFTRNDQRPLSLVKGEHYSLLVSEQGLGKWIMERNNEKILESHELTPNVLYRVKDNTPTTIEEVGTYEKKYYPTQTYTPPSGLWNQYGTYGLFDDDHEENPYLQRHHPHTGEGAEAEWRRFTKIHKKGEYFAFSLVGYEKNKAFASIVGSKDSFSFVEVRGNTTLTEAEIKTRLTSKKWAAVVNTLVGIITSINFLPKKNKLVVNVKDIQIMDWNKYTDLRFKKAQKNHPQTTTTTTSESKIIELNNQRKTANKELPKFIYEACSECKTPTVVHNLNFVHGKGLLCVDCFDAAILEAAEG